MYSGRLAHAQNGPIRVCFVIDRLSRAGTETQLLLLLKQLDRTRITPYLCLLDGFDDTSLSLLPEHCSTLQLGIRRLASLHAFRQGWRFLRFLRTERIDIVQTYFRDSTRFAAPIAKTAGVRAVCGSRRNIGHWVTKQDARIGRLYNRWFIDTIIANCDAARISCIEQEGARPEQVVVIHNAIDLDRFKHIPPWQPKRQGQPRKVGMVGNLRTVKGPDLFIRAAQLVLKELPNTQFEIAGAGDLGLYQALIEELRLADNVRLLGEVVDIPGFLATLDVAVLPSRAEGQSNALSEYMAAGRPIVATDVGGNVGLLGSLAGQGCISTCSFPMIAERIVRFLSDDNLAESVGHLLRQRATALCTHAVADIHNIYSHCTSAADSPLPAIHGHG